MKKGLGKELFVDLMAGYILEEDIKVQKIALDQNVVVKSVFNQMKCIGKPGRAEIQPGTPNAGSPCDP